MSSAIVRVSSARNASITCAVCTITPLTTAPCGKFSTSNNVKHTCASSTPSAHARNAVEPMSNPSNTRKPPPSSNDNKIPNDTRGVDSCVQHRSSSIVYIIVNPWGTCATPNDQKTAAFRSEEHTSELQSRGHLV